MKKEIEHPGKLQSLTPIRGHALNAVVLLRDWEKYGLAERICYHFDLTGALAGSEQERGDPNKTNSQEGLTRESVCGVLRVLECIPTTTQGQKLSRKDGRALKRSLLRFNAMSRTVMEQRQFFCHEPPLLPLRLVPASRLFFAYELTRIAFCLDAKATLTNTYGFGSSTGQACCPIDRLADMTRLFFTALAQTIHAPGVSMDETWKPELAVSVIAVFPSEGKSGDIDLLVRDFRVTDTASADLLAKKVREWALGEVESKIADRLAYRDGSWNGRSSYDAWSMPFQSSSLRDILDAADVCLENLSSAARPAVVIATDCSSVGCDGTFDLLWDKDRSDLPISVLDLSGPPSYHARTQSRRDLDLSAFTLLTMDPLGGTFPLHLSDDKEALQAICRASGGAFWNADLLEQGARTSLGNVGPDSPFASDHLFSSPQHTLQTNAVQWYTLFNLSHLSPRQQPTFGVPPTPYSIYDERATVFDSQGRVKSPSLQIGRPFGGEGTKHVLTNTPIRTMLSSYIINPVPIKGLIMMRVREGYRVKQYGQSTLDPAKVSMQFTLGLDAGVVLHYELAYKSLTGLNNMIGFAHVKVELYGDPSLIQMVKRDFVHGNLGSPNSSDQQISDRICKLLRWMRKEDTLQSSLSPIKWGDQLKSPDSPFVRRLGILSALQQRRHFRLDEFDCVCVGNMPYDVGEHDFLSEFRDHDDGSEQLIEALDVWSSQYIKKNECFVKQTISGTQSVPAYCIVKVARSPNAGRIWTVSVNTMGGSGASDRLSFVFSLKKLLGKLSHVRVLRSQMGKFLVSTRNLHFGTERRTASELMVEKYCDHSTWELVTDPELLPLLIKRRTEIGNFLLLESCDHHALLAKIVHKSDARNEPGTLVQYQLSVAAEKVVVDFHIESESGQFSHASRFAPSILSEFHRLVQTLGKRDQECALALQSRRALLLLLNESKVPRYATQLQIAYVQRLLGYASSSILRMRFYQGMETTANEHLRRLTEQMLLSQPFGPRVAKLGIDSNYLLDGKGPGDWFLVEYDKSTLGLVHFPQEYITKSVNDLTTSHIDMAFYTVGVGDLYSQRDDVIEDGSDDDHITEYMCVTDFTDSLERGHRRNYACSAYLAALDSTLRDEAFYFASDDFSHALSELTFLEVIRVDIMEEMEGAASKLYEVLSSALEPVPGDELCFVYHPSPLTDLRAKYDEDEELTSIESLDDEDGGLVKNIEEEDASVLQTNLLDDSSSNTSVSATSTGGNEFRGVRPVPVFVKILIDDELASIQDLKNLQRSASIAALLSLYKEDPFKTSKRQTREFPPSHISAISDLSSLLNSHVAEQHLERLRNKGSEITEDDLRLARICLRQARFSVASTVDILFYVSKSDSMISPSTAARDDTAFEESFKVLSNQLTINKDASLRVFDDGFSFVILELSKSSNLSYFCFLRIRRSRALIAVEVYHPAGSEESAKVMQKMHELVSQCCHRTNQILLLEHLHASKNASSLLIPPDSGNASQNSLGVKEKTSFDTGVFQCPTLFRTTFELFHRCATNPLQVARTLEATVLHIFAVSNRMRVFVYKDEQGSIFYMMLSARGGGIESDGEIELLVHGIDEPGPSVTKQLRELLQKRLHNIAVEMLSSVLTKNPRYFWKQADIDFVLSFENIWNQLDDGDSPSALASPHIRKYAFPKIDVDPGMVLLYFQQNICGSTLFQQLLAPDSIFVQGLDGDDNTSCTGDDLPNMMFYYNNNSSKLDPEFQGLSTLTKRGAEFSRMIGPGVALIEVCLIDKEGRKLSALPSVKDTIDLDNEISVDLEHMRMIDFMHLSDDKHESEHGSQIFVQIKVYDTALKRDVLHEWLKLTLDQGLTAWAIENLLRRMQTDGNTNSGVVGDFSRDKAINSLCPGLPAIASVLETSYNLPHPAVLKFEHEGSDLRATNVAKFAFELTTGVILEQMRLEAKELAQGQELPTDLCTIRLSRNVVPELVDLSHFRPNRQDEPVDCPEYIVFYQSCQGENGPPKLFEHVAINDKSAKSDPFVGALARMRENNPKIFMRSLAFVLVVKRNRRLLLAYNWSTSLFEKIATRVVAKENQMSNIARSSVDTLQRYSLRILAPRSERTTKEHPAKLPVKAQMVNNREETPKVASSNQPSASDVLNTESQSAPRRRISRPTSIRKPQLIGKSVEGSALHAVAASRARASSNLFKGNPSGNTSAQKQPIQTRKGQVARLKGAMPKAAIDRRQANRPNTYVDPQKASIHKHYSSLANSGQTRTHTEQVKTTNAANTAVWPSAIKKDLSFAGAWSLLQENGLGWALVSEMLPFPPTLRPSFISSFARLTTSWTQDLMVLPLHYKNDSSEWSMISSKTRAVISAKCVCITRLSVTGTIYPMVTAESFVLLLPRRQKDRRAQMKKRRCLSTLMREKDATAVDLLALRSKQLLRLDKALFDHAASIAEGAMRSVDGYVEFRDVLKLVQDLIFHRTLVDQRLILRSNYRAFSTKIVLSSFCNPSISKYDGPTLFKWLSSTSNNRSMIQCGDHGLCLKREVLVNGTSSMCFMTKDTSSTDSLCLVILCRTQGRNLQEFMFRPGSHIAISIVDNIAVECAGLAYQELRVAARLLNRDNLWTKISGKSRFGTPTLNEIEELMSLCVVKPASEFLKSNLDLERTKMVCNGNVLGEWKHYCSRLEREPAFSPSWPLGPARRLFYCRDEDLFLILTAHSDKTMTIEVMEREEKYDTNSRSRLIFAVQKLLNYLLLSSWNDMGL